MRTCGRLPLRPPFTIFAHRFPRHGAIGNVFQVHGTTEIRYAQPDLLRHHGAGGIGRRFWPLSRQSQPKQFLDILGTGKSLLRMTYERFRKIVPEENILVVTNIRYKDLVREHLPELSNGQILCEPTGRNTAPCICYAASVLKKRDPKAKMIVTPSDPSDPRSGGFPPDHRRLPRLRRHARCPDDRRHHPDPARHRLRLHPGLVRPADQQGEMASPKNRASNWPRPSCRPANFSGIRVSSSGRLRILSRRSAATCPITTPSSKRSKRRWGPPIRRRSSPGASPSAAPSRSTTA